MFKHIVTLYHRYQSYRWPHKIWQDGRLSELELATMSFGNTIKWFDPKHTNIIVPKSGTGRWIPDKKGVVEALKNVHLLKSESISDLELHRISVSKKFHDSAPTVRESVVSAVAENKHVRNTTNNDIEGVSYGQGSVVSIEYGK